MTKYFLSLLLVFACGYLAAQDTLTLADVDAAPVLKYRDIAGAKSTDSPDKLLLLAVYNTIRYPREARKNGMMATLRAQWLVNADGELVVENIALLSEKEVLLSPESNVDLTIMANIPGGVRGQAYYRIDNPEMNKSQREEQRKLESLVEEVRRTLDDLPRFEPGSKAGVPVTTRYERLFLFRIE